MKEDKGGGSIHRLTLCSSNSSRDTALQSQGESNRNTEEQTHQNEAQDQQPEGSRGTGRKPNGNWQLGRQISTVFAVLKTQRTRTVHSNLVTKQKVYSIRTGTWAAISTSVPHHGLTMALWLLACMPWRVRTTATRITMNRQRVKRPSRHLLEPTERQCPIAVTERCGFKIESRAMPHLSSSCAASRQSCTLSLKVELAVSAALSPEKTSRKQH